MTATARPVPARATPRPAPSRPAPERSRRPHLQVVPPPRARRAGVVVAAAIVVVFGSLLGTAVLHTMLVSGQRDLDRLDARIAETQQANRALELEVAQLESPARIVAAAEADGMVLPERVVWVSPTPDGTEVETDTTPDTDTTPETEAGTETDERAGEEPGASEGAGTAG